MAVLIESCEKTKSGKAWRVKASGLYYNAFLDSGIENHVGKYIEAEIHTHEKFGNSIASFKVVPAAAPAPAVSPKETTPTTREREPHYAEPAKPGTVAPWWWPSVSNVWAAQSAAGNIKSPNDLATWAKAVRMAAEKANEELDPIPF